MMAEVFREVLVYAGWFVPALVWGAWSYWTLMKTEDAWEVLFFLVGAGICIINTAIVFLMDGPQVAIIMLLILAVLCALPAWLEHKVNARFGWKYYYGKLVLATGQSFLVGYNAVFIAQESGVSFGLQSMYPLYALAAGLAFTPPAISELQWIWHNSVVRLGLDVPIE